MKLYENFRGNYKDDPITTFDLKQWEDEKEDRIVGVGLGAKPTFAVPGLTYLDFEIPIPDLKSSFLDYHQFCDKIVNLCPYTTEWMNKKIGPKFVNSFFPLNSDYLPLCNVEVKKDIDVCYIGQNNSAEISNIVTTIKGFNHAWVSFGSDNVDYRGLNYNKKLDVIARSKIVVCHNLWWPTEDYINKIKSIDGYKNNKAFERIDEGMAPQLKSRCFEAAFCKSLMLVRQDPWNVIEQYFAPEIDFLYYKPEKLAQNIKDLLSTWDKFSYWQEIVNNAHKKACENYSVGDFVEKVIEYGCGY